MARKYVRKVGSRPYKTEYSDAALKEAVDNVKQGSLCIREASNAYNIPYATLWRKVNTVQMKKPGVQPVLKEEEEAKFVKMIEILIDWKFPITGDDICTIVKDYLDSLGVKTVFKDNKPGPDWLAGFKNRHNMTSRVAQNIKVSRAEINPDTITNFFNNLGQSIKDIPDTNIFNFDETNVKDEPESKRVICSRGLRRVERKIQSSKSMTSVMFCGSAAGVYLPPMVIYKAGSMHAEWKRGGPEGACYNVTESGWFNTATFEEWFFNIFIKHVENAELTGKIALIGDNLGSHFSPRVIEACLERNIVFIALLPNATHLLQPLDVCVFRSLKKVWREILEKWRLLSRWKQGIPKSQFPSLLQQLWSKLSAKNLASGFKACGIYPFNPNAVIKRFPRHLPDCGTQNNVLNDATMRLLQNNLYGDPSQNTRRGKRKGNSKNIVAGKQVRLSNTGLPTTEEMVLQQDDDDENAGGDSANSNALCGICQEKEPACSSSRSRSRLIDWSGCCNCDMWFHVVCLRGRDATDFCSCTQ